MFSSDSCGEVTLFDSPESGLSFCIVIIEFRSLFFVMAFLPLDRRAICYGRRVWKNLGRLREFVDDKLLAGL